ncbi:MAG TPA: Ig domain-containing protein, partial [Isosphaeraceae bacterium]|nr:Ig domain-containing protein [Isosphaeraceae bacterium]
MSRRRSRRMRKLQVETLEKRQMLSRDVVHTMAMVSRMIPPRPELDPAARTLILDPQTATNLNLGTLGRALRSHPAIARLEGPGGLLAFELKTHPGYTATHGLEWMLQPWSTSLGTGGVASPTTPSANNSIQDTSTNSSSDSTASTTLDSPATGGSSSVSTSPTPISVTPQNLFVSVGGYLDFSILPGSFHEGSATYTITPQPLPANMTFNRGSGELTFSPAPGQAGTYQFQVLASDGQASYLEPVLVHVS